LILGVYFMSIMIDDVVRKVKLIRSNT